MQTGCGLREDSVRKSVTRPCLYEIVGVRIVNVCECYPESKMFIHPPFVKNEFITFIMIFFIINNYSKYQSGSIISIEKS